MFILAILALHNFVELLLEMPRHLFVDFGEDCISLRVGSIGQIAVLDSLLVRAHDLAIDSILKSGLSLRTPLTDLNEVVPKPLNGIATRPFRVLVARSVAARIIAATVCPGSVSQDLDMSRPGSGGGASIATPRSGS